MIVSDYKGHRISNAMEFTKTYRLLTGSDFLKDLKNLKESEDVTSFYCNLYFSFRKAGENAISMEDYDKVIDEVDFLELADPSSEFYSAIGKMLTPSKKAQADLTKTQ